MTGKLQPADATLQRVFKHAAKQAWCEEFAAIIKKHVDDGADPSTLKIAESVDILRNRLARCMDKAYKSIDDRAIVEAAWRSCKVGDYSLGLICDMEFGLRCVRELDELGGQAGAMDMDTDDDETLESAHGSWDDGDELSVDELKEALKEGVADFQADEEDEDVQMATVLESPVRPAHFFCALDRIAH